MFIVPLTHRFVVRLDDRHSNVLIAIGAGFMLAAIAWVPATMSLHWWPWRIVPPIAMFLIGVVLVGIVWRSNTMRGMSSFIRMGKGSKIKNSAIVNNKSEADDFIDMGDDSEIEDTEIAKNIQETPGGSHP